MELRSDLSPFVAALISEAELIPAARKELLLRFASYVASRSHEERIALNFICTHNSRRSHLAQIWAATAAYYYAIPNIQTFSGGTEATAFNPRAVAAMERAGFKIEAVKVIILFIRFPSPPKLIRSNVSVKYTITTPTLNPSLPPL
mgnify:CR=1 FL=1